MYSQPIHFTHELILRILITKSKVVGRKYNLNLSLQVLPEEKAARAARVDAVVRQDMEDSKVHSKKTEKS